jgi:uncharacterized membrane protein YphA (DoxX/SURF4 family)
MNKTANLLLRIGVAFAFIYAGISGLVNPDSWIGYFPTFLQSNTILIVWGIVEVILGLWILSGRNIFIPALLGGLSMIGVIIFNWSQMDILFRDVTIMLAALALAIEAYNKPVNDNTVPV